MSKPLKPRRGTTAEQNAFVGEEYEITYDTDKNTIVCRDGLTAGGFPLAKEADINAFKTAQSTKDAQQDSAIQQAQTAANNAINGAVTSAVIDGLDLVLTYGNGTTKRVPLPTGKGVGDMWFGVDPKSKPANVQAYSGQLLPRSAYPAHWAFVNGGNRTVISESQWQAQVSANGFCPYYSSGDGSTTYRMPSLKGVHPKFVAALAEAGGYTAAGLPNITGYTGYGRDQSDYSSGPFYRSGTGKQVGQFYASTTGHNAYIFDASRSNPIYGNSNTVQPPAVNIILGEYVVGAVAALGEANATSLLASVTRLESEVGAKAGSDLANVTTEGKARAIGWMMPDYSAGISLSEKQSYTVPADGFVSAQRKNVNDGPIYVNDVYVAHGSTNNSVSSATFYVCKGDVIRPISGGQFSSNSYFWPLKGA